MFPHNPRVWPPPQGASDASRSFAASGGNATQQSTPHPDSGTIAENPKTEVMSGTVVDKDIVAGGEDDNLPCLRSNAELNWLNRLFSAEHQMIAHDYTFVDHLKPDDTFHVQDKSMNTTSTYNPQSRTDIPSEYAGYLQPSLDHLFSPFTTQQAVGSVTVNNNRPLAMPYPTLQATTTDKTAAKEWIDGKLPTGALQEKIVEQPKGLLQHDPKLTYDVRSMPAEGIQPTKTFATGPEPASPFQHFTTTRVLTFDGSLPL